MRPLLLLVTCTAMKSKHVPLIRSLYKSVITLVSLKHIQNKPPDFRALQDAPIPGALEGNHLDLNGPPKYSWNPLGGLRGLPSTP